MRTLLFFLFLSSSFIKAQTLVKGPYLQVGTPNSIIIRWETNVATDSRVEYGTSPTSLSSFTTSAIIDTTHVLKITGLLPFTKYFYSVGTSTGVIQGDTNNYFVTSPLPGAEGKYRFWVNGDCGNLSINQANCKAQYNLFNGNRLTNGWLLLGDNAYYYGTNYEYNTEFFNVYQTDIMKHAVLWPSPGNHDYNNGATKTPTVPYFTIFSMPTAAEAGGFPSGTKRYYSYDYGNVHFMSLDSYGADGNLKMYDTLSTQALWVKQDLAANTKKWTVAYWHHPPYTMGSHNSDTELDLDSVRVNFIRILERSGVDLILCGHSHSYERSKLMRGHYGNEASFVSSIHNLDTSTALYNGSANSCPYVKDTIAKKAGTVYVVAGSGGWIGPAQTSFPHSAMYFSDATNGGTAVLDIEANRLDLKWLCADGLIRDNFTMFKNVNKVSSFTITPTQTISLNASWPGNYIWSTTDTLRTTSVSPTTNTTYWVKDKFNCVADTFKVFISPVGIKEFSSAKNQTLLLYPNPTKENIILKLSLKEKSDVGMKLFSSEGKLLKEYEPIDFPAGENNISVWMTDLKLQAGVYFLQINFNGATVTDKFIITK